MNIAIYARVSTEIQAHEGHSLGAQVEDCKAKAYALGATMVKEYIDDGYSGAYLERPALAELREALRLKMFHAVVVYDVDRLSRNLSHQLLLTDEIEHSGATLHFVKSDYQNTPEGRLFYAMRGAFAGYEREKFRERSMRGKVAMLQKGLVIEDSHVYGYDYNKETRSYTINPGEAAAILAIYDRYLAGKGGARQVTFWLNETGQFPPPSGRAWAVSTVRDILRRQMYTGKYFSHRIYHQKTGIKSARKILRPPSEWVEMTCPAIINEEQHKQALYLMERNRKLSRRKEKSPAMLQGLVFCGKCGRMLHVRHGGSQSRYYMCWESHSNGISRPGCGARSAQVEAVDNAVWELLESLCHSPKDLKRYMEATMPATPKVDESAKRKEKLEKIKAERKAVMQWYSQQLLSHDEATERLEALKTAEQKLLKDNISPAPIARQIDYQAVCEAVATCLDNPFTRREIFRQLIDKVVLTRTDSSSGVKNYELDIQLHFR